MQQHDGDDGNGEVEPPTDGDAATDPPPAVAPADPTSDRARELHDLLGEAEELTVVCHDNPDPDCLASALALSEIATDAGVGDVVLCYGGSISHQQNRAFVNLLEVELRAFEPALLDDRLVAFVDHSVPGENNAVPTDTEVDVVIDHHPAESVEARFVDHRESAGATATILTEYVRALGLGLDGRLATALLFAVRRETLGFLRGVTAAEHEAAAVLHPHADSETLRRLASPPVTGATADALGTAIDNREVRGSVLISHVGRTGERDALPQAADYLVELEGVQTAVIFGIVENCLELSGRTTDSRIHVGEVLAEAFDDVGSAGGHREMAGGRVPLGLFADASADERLVGFVEGIVTDRLVEAMNLPEDETEEE
ncbi:DHH family phosphoesterase [Haloglomus litoreum]|uniref:DHH family phosphoesterase n=1 Tax=Haloglomus litoreum TaxID=3034026 RepID=UPI0023E8D43A|nr:bifunctional oligoribonuclease/PAP phosphatase NrnA [Haloglomus sp. DT116]